MSEIDNSRLLVHVVDENVVYNRQGGMSIPLACLLVV